MNFLTKSAGRRRGGYQASTYVFDSRAPSFSFRGRRQHDARSLCAAKYTVMLVARF
ncbi:MAG: hypothetical protein H7Z74_16605 [Anaerolineae bacterium]|nr:hypothetical protein [Gemmatimonadaceae bacterium]